MASIEPGTLSPGDTIAGYRIDAVLDRGGMGIVYRATQLALGQQYALKVIAPELSYDSEFRDRFKRETMVAASLRHPNIVAVHYAGDQEGVLFLAMDCIDGTDLRQVLRRGGGMHPDRAVTLLGQVTSALDEAHAHGIVHRDVKPANVLIEDRGGREHAYLTDFGLTKRLDAESGVTKTGMFVGTVDYMAPEQAAGARLDARADVYAVGCVLFEMLTGNVPFDRPDTIATLFAHRYDPPPALRSIRPDLSPAFEQVVSRALAKDPADRYMSAGDLARAANAAAAGAAFSGVETVVATGEARPEPAQHVSPAPSMPPSAAPPPPPAPSAAWPPSPAPSVSPLPPPPPAAPPFRRTPEAAALPPQSRHVAPVSRYKAGGRHIAGPELVAGAAGLGLLVALFLPWGGVAFHYNAFRLVYHTNAGFIALGKGLPIWPFLVACVVLAVLVAAFRSRPLAVLSAIAAGGAIFLIAKTLTRFVHTVVPWIALALAVLVLVADLVALARSPDRR